MTTAKTYPEREIIEIAEEMTANDFLLEFGMDVTVHDMDNLLNPNQGSLNISIPIDGPEHNLFLLFENGIFNTYSY